jgi:hypothetical protein
VGGTGRPWSFALVVVVAAVWVGGGWNAAVVVLRLRADDEDW